MRLIKPRVMVVEDDAVIRRLVRAALEVEGHEVIEVVNAAGLRQAFRVTIPDLVVLDLQLPDGDGLDLLPELKKNWPHAKVIILTGQSTVEAAEKASLVGEVYLQCKPFNAGILQALVDLALHHSAAAPSKDEIAGG